MTFVVRFQLSDNASVNILVLGADDPAQAIELAKSDPVYEHFRHLIQGIPVAQLIPAKLRQ